MAHYGQSPRGTRTDAERARESQVRRAVRTIQLPGAVMAAIDAIKQRDGDASLVACLTRLVRSAQ